MQSYAFGKKNEEHKYEMDLGPDVKPHKFDKSLVERDLDLMVSKWVAHIDKDSKATKAIIAQIKNSFTYFDAELVGLLSVSLVRPNLEFEAPVWNPYFKKYIEKLEDIQQKFTRLVPKLKKKEYLD